jgi:hypothetical protein
MSLTVAAVPVLFVDIFRESRKIFAVKIYFVKMIISSDKRGE